MKSDRYVDALVVRPFVMGEIVGRLGDVVRLGASWSAS